MTTSISLPAHIFSAADNLAKTLDISRSELYRCALAEYLAKHGYRGVTEQLNEVHGTRPRRLTPEQWKELCDVLNRTEF